MTRFRAANVPVRSPDEGVGGAKNPQNPNGRGFPRPYVSAFDQQSVNRRLLARLFP